MKSFSRRSSTNRRLSELDPGLRVVARDRLRRGNNGTAEWRIRHSRAGLPRAPTRGGNPGDVPLGPRFRGGDGFRGGDVHAPDRSPVNQGSNINE